HVTSNWDANSTVLSLEGLMHGPLWLQRRVLRLAIEDIRGDLFRIEQDTIDAVLRAAANRERLVIQLPSNGAPPCQIVVEGDSLRVARILPPILQAEWSVELPAEGMVTLPVGTSGSRPTSSPT